MYPIFAGTSRVNTIPFRIRVFPFLSPLIDRNIPESTGRCKAGATGSYYRGCRGRHSYISAPGDRDGHGDGDGDRDDDVLILLRGTRANRTKYCSYGGPSLIGPNIVSKNG